MDVTTFLEKYNSVFRKFNIFVEFIDRSPTFGGPKQTADYLVKSLGFNPIGASWINLDDEYEPFPGGKKGDPLKPLMDNLQFTMAYRGKMLSIQRAEECAKDFYTLFSNGRRVRLSNHIEYGWTPVTPATFDAVHIAMDRKLIGMILMMDED